MGTFITFLVVAGIFSMLLGGSFRRTVGNILSTLLGIVLVGGFIVWRVLANGTILLILGVIALIIAIIVGIIRSRRRPPHVNYNHTHNNHNHNYVCNYDCYQCPHRQHCNYYH